MFDFNKLRSSLLASEETRKTPQEIFNESVQDQITYLRSVQDEVLKKWYDKRQRKINLLKMNTGAGKTLVGLLILLTLSKEKKGKMLYVTPDRYLTDQVIYEARKLNIKLADSENDINYLMGNSVLVINISKLVNGLSVFGVQNKNEKTADYIVFDDSHSCIKVVKEQFTLKVTSSNVSFDYLFNIFKQSLQKNGMSTTLQIEQHDPTAIMRIPFYSWVDNIEVIAKYLVNAVNNELSEDTEVKFTYPLIKDLLPYCEASISGNEIVIYPIEQDLSSFAGISSSKNQIYMSATLGDDSELSLLLNIQNNLSEMEVLAPDSAGDVGERIILSPFLFSRDISYDQLDTLIVKYSKSYNVLVLVTSFKRSEHWSSLGANVISSDNIESELSKLKSGEVTHSLNVLVNRYNGIDLPKNSCRLIVMDGVPRVYDTRELALSSFIDISHRMKSNTISLIEQGMGRGIRDNKDWCGILIYDIELSNFIFVDDNLQYFSDATKKQIELSKKAIELCRNDNNLDVIQSIDECFKLIFDRNEDWIEISMKMLSSLKNNSLIQIDESDIFAKNAYIKYCQQDYINASALQEKAANLACDAKLKAAYKERLARYKYYLDKNESQEILLSANRDNNQVCKPWDRIINPTDFMIRDQVVSIISHFDHDKTLLKFTELASKLYMDPDCSFNQFEAAWAEVGAMLGAQSFRPEREFSGTTIDVLWLSKDIAISFSCKNQAYSETIKKEYIDAMHSDVVWIENHYKDKKIFSVILYPKGVPSEKVLPDKNLFVLSKENLSKFINKTFDLFKILNDNYSLSEPFVNNLLHKEKLSFDVFVSEYCEKMESIL